MNKRLLILFLFVAIIFKGYGQLTNGVTGLLHMPNAEMQRDGTFMIGGNYLDKHNLPDMARWDHNFTYNYFINITFFHFMEVSYVCTLFRALYNGTLPESYWGDFTNQDRHFALRFRLIKEGQFWKYMPAVVAGVNDPTTQAQGDGYYYGSVGENGNGYFNRWYIAMTKHFEFKGVGELGVHAAYLYNRRKTYLLNSPAFGVNFRPSFHKNLNLIAEYDAKTINVGATYSLWADHFNLLFELQKGKCISAGFVYKVNLLGGNNWKARLFDYK